MSNSQPKKTNSKPSINPVSSSIDLSIFNNNEIIQQALKFECDYKKCLCVARVLSSLKYFTLLESKNNPTNQSIFGAFINDIYNTLILYH